MERPRFEQPRMPDEPAPKEPEVPVEAAPDKPSAKELTPEEKALHEAERARYEELCQEADLWVTEAGYEPWSAEVSVRDLLKLSPEEQALPVRERRRLKAERLKAFHESLRERHRKAGLLIGELRNMVLSRPEETTDQDLRAQVFERAKSMHMPAKELRFFLVGIDRYWRQHQAVEKYRAEYPDDLALTEAAFGVRPTGEVQVEKRPAGLLFRVFDEDDYVNLYTAPMPDTDPRLEQRRKEALRAGGFASRFSKILQLRGTLMVERMHEEPRYRGPVKERRVALRGKAVYILRSSSEDGPTDISVDGVGRWQLNHAMTDRFSRTSTWSLSRVDENGSVVVRELEETHGVFKDKEGNASAEFNADLTGADGLAIGVFVADADKFEVKFNEERDFEMTYRKVPDDRPYHERTLKHEEQHIFDYIMELYNKADDRDILRGVAVAEATGQDPVPGMLRSLARRKRSLIADLRARSEYLAFYRDGRNLNVARDFLADENGSYAYGTSHKGGLERIAENVASEFATVAGDVLPGKTVTTEQALEAVREVFGPEYQKLLTKWKQAMETVELKLDASEDRESVIALLSTESINSWPRLARMLRPAKPQEDSH